MSPLSTVATDSARRLWARVAGDGEDAAAAAAAARRIGELLKADLGRWIGADGYGVLFERALGRARADHPALGGLAFPGATEPAVANPARPLEADQVAAGMVALVAELIELLGRIVGLEMAVRLVDHAGAASGRGAVKEST